MERMYFMAIIGWLVGADARFDGYGVYVFDKYYIHRSDEDMNELYRLFKESIGDAIPN